jgi:hypothetical protein
VDAKFPPGQHTLDPETKEELKRDVYRRLDEFIMGRIIEAFSDTDVLEFERLLQQGRSQEELWGFARSHIPNFDAINIQALTDFRDAYLYS